MTKAFVRRDDTNKPSNKSKFHIKRSMIFVILMLLYPVLQFLIMWFGVNINSIFLTFQVVKSSKLVWVSFSNFFENYKNVILDFSNPDVRQMYINSLAYFVLNCLITLPVSLFFSYFIFKKIYAGGVFKTIFYLPSVLPVVALTIVFKYSFSAQGFLAPFFNAIGVDNAKFFIGDNAKWMVWVFCFWTGIGYDVMLLTSGMSRIPRDLLESAKMDGVPAIKEFIYVIIPLTWPTITTLFIFGMMGVFGTYLQPMLLTGYVTTTNTIGLQIFLDAQGVAKNYPATMGLMCTIVATPIVLGVRAFLNHFFKEVNF